MYIAKILNCLSQNEAEILVHALFHPSWTFATHFCMGYHDRFSIDYSIFKTVLLSRCPELEAENTYEHILRQLHWLPIKHRIAYKILLLTYKAMNGMSLKYIVDLLKRYTPTRQLRYSSNNLLVMQKSNLKSYGDSSFRVAAPRLWNASPNSIRLIQIPKCF